LQGFLAIFTIFVDYAKFYVNMIMLTVLTVKSIKCAYFAHKGTSWASHDSAPQNIDFASNPAKSHM
jgi:hypothetical protein